MAVAASQRHDIVATGALTATEAAQAAWTVATGTKVGGARAVALALAVAWASPLPLLPWKVPGLPWLLDRLYELLARNRHRLPGATPWCAEHPGECTAQDATGT